MFAVGQTIRDKPAVPTEDETRLRVLLVLEEAFEFAEACTDASDLGYIHHLKELSLAAYRKNDSPVRIEVNLAAAADALADLDYVSEGARQCMGIDGNPIAEEVQRTNMAKLAGGKDANGKHMKPAGWKPPDIAKLLKEQGWEGDENA